MSSVLKEFRSVKGFHREPDLSSFHLSEKNIGKKISWKLPNGDTGAHILG